MQANRKNKKQSLGLRLFALAFLFSVVFAGGLHLMVYQLFTKKMDPLSQAFVYFIRNVVELNPEKPVNNLDMIRKSTRNIKNIGSWETWLVDGEGKVLDEVLTHGPPPPVSLEKYSKENLNPQMVRERASLREWVMVVPLESRPTRWLLIRKLRLDTGGMLVFTGLVIFELSTVLGSSLIALLLVGYYFSQRAKQARSVLKRIHNGELNARFEFDRLDQVTQIMATFNEMADDIERLLSRLRESENSRTTMLKELAHDLKTPLTNISCLSEMVADLCNELPPEEVKSKMDIVVHEVQYFRRLIEDLFLLAQIDQSRETQSFKRVNTKSLIEEETQRLMELEESFNKIQFDITGPEGTTTRGEPHQLRRLFRNGLENACAFARNRVWVIASVDDASGMLKIKIRDDGKGFSTEALEQFGKRRQTRLLEANRTGRASLGLGSTIMQAVAESHGGKIQPGNWKEGNAQGGEITILLPLAADEEPLAIAA